VITIIFLLGYNFSIFTQTNSIVLDVLATSTIYIIVLFIVNVLGLSLYCKYKPNVKFKFISTSLNNKKDSAILTTLKACKFLIYLVIGYILGEIININITHIVDNIVYILLLALMFIVGVLLKLENIPLGVLFKNKVALAMVFIVVITSFIAAIAMSFIMDIPLKESIMISSGLGWYSLSVVLNSSFIGEYYGMVTFMVDFLREIMVIAFVPFLRRFLSIELIGFAANTAMDFCLPVIKNNYSTKAVPLAISIGLIFTIITPGLLILENLIL
jgi:uncharacterized membrane protein YbjE (DUF340 family)